MNLKETLSSFALSSTGISILEELGIAESFEKQEFISKKGQFNAKEYVVIDGVCRTCLYNSDGAEATLGFYTEGMVIAPYVIRTEGQVSKLNIQASTALELVSFDAGAFEQLMVDNLEIRAFGNEVLKRELAKMYQKEIDMGALGAKERLVQFRKRYPMLENRIPHAQIASFLGITTVSMSRLRRALMF